MEQKEVEVQEFNGKEYFLYDTVTTDSNYNIFCQVDEVDNIIVAKEVIEQEQVYYEILEEEARDEIMNIYQQKKDN